MTGVLLAGVLLAAIAGLAPGLGAPPPRRGHRRHQNIDEIVPGARDETKVRPRALPSERISWLLSGQGTIDCGVERVRSTLVSPMMSGLKPSANCQRKRMSRRLASCPR